MRKSQFSEEQIAHALREAEAGTPVKEVIRGLGIAEQTFYRWKRKFEGMGVAELRRLRLLEEENNKLKRLVADLSLDKRILQDVIEKKPLRGLRSKVDGKCLIGRWYENGVRIGYPPRVAATD